MIEYERTNWYGLGYLLRLRGSLLPHCLPAMVLAGTVAGLFASPVLEQTFALQTAQLFVDKYSMQLFGVVFGYLAVARLNVCYNRYWEGATHVKAMHSKFADAASQIILFDSVDDSSHDVSHKAFCVHIVRLFLQLSAVVTITLHLDQDEIGTFWRKLQAELQAAETAAGGMYMRGPAHSEPCALSHPLYAYFSSSVTHHTGLLSPSQPRTRCPLKGGEASSATTSSSRGATPGVSRSGHCTTTRCAARSPGGTLSWRGCGRVRAGLPPPLPSSTGTMRASRGAARPLASGRGRPASSSRTRSSLPSSTRPRPSSSTGSSLRRR